MAISAATDLTTQLWTSRCSIYHGGLGRILQLVFLHISLEQRSSRHLMTIVDNSLLQCLHLGNLTRSIIWPMNSTSQVTHGIPQLMTCRTFRTTIVLNANYIMQWQSELWTKFVIHITWLMAVRLQMRLKRTLGFVELLVLMNCLKMS